MSLRNSCSKAEPPQHLFINLECVPIRVLALDSLAHNGFRHFIKLEADLQAPLRRHATICFDLLPQAILRVHGPLPVNFRCANAKAPCTTTSSTSAAGTMS